MNKSPEIAGMKQNESTLFLHGPLTRHTVSGLYKHFKNQYPGKITMIDCTQTGPVDSTGVCFLLACIKILKESGKTVKITGLNTQTIKLATLYEVDELLEPQ